jgi:microsomal dipeptidase-like Zn-dependent dipeptidase
MAGKGRLPVIVDLHAHYPMHLLIRATTKKLRRQHDTVALMTHPRRRHWGDRFRALLLWLANRLFNYSKSGDPVVTIPNLRAGGVHVALSVLYVPFDELDFSERYGAPPARTYFPHLVRQIRRVEKEVSHHPHAAVAHNPVQLATILHDGKVALIHAVEGGFHLGDTPEQVHRNVHTLATTYGVAYITIAHLFWRKVATNSPGVPFLPDKTYGFLFPQPALGLCQLGIAVVEAMVHEHILIDLTHMSEHAIDDTLQLLDRLDPASTVPVIATHSACRLGGLAYNLSNRHIKAIEKRRGVVGLIACRHYMADGLARPRKFDDSMGVICRHIDKIHQVTGSHDSAAFGSDMDGFIRPTLPGLETPVAFKSVEERLLHAYGPGPAQQICSGNAMRVLSYWTGVP